MKAHEPFQPVQLAVPDQPPIPQRATQMDQTLQHPPEQPQALLLKNVRTNIVQSIRAYHPDELMDAAAQLGQHFLYVDLGLAQTKQEVLEMIAAQFGFPPHFGKNFDALFDCMTDPLHKSGPQPGFIVVLEHIPATPRFDKETREQLLDIFRDTADYWAERKVPFRCFYSFP